jgi:outer membrane lipoprotein-sorting protein
MKRIWFLIVFAALWGASSFASEVSVDQVVRERDRIMRGDSSKGKYEMQIISPRWKRTLKMDTWSSGNDRSFIVITYPKKDKDTTFLRVKADMWQYVPAIEKTIKIPPSMMLQSWMGSDFTNDDLVKESSIVNDYTHKLLEETENLYVIESIPKPEAPVVWGRVVQRVDKETCLPVNDEFYDEDGTLIRKIIYDDVKKLPDRRYPMRWTVKPMTEDKEGRLTVITIDEVEFNMPVEESVFSMQALKKYSR